MYDSIFREEFRELLDSRSVSTFRSVLKANSWRIVVDYEVVCATKPRLSIARQVRPWECSARDETELIGLMI